MEGNPSIGGPCTLHFIHLIVPAALALLTFHLAAAPAKPPVKPAVVFPESHEVLRGHKGIELIVEDPSADAEAIKLTTTIREDLFNESYNLNETVTLRRPKPTICPATTVWTKQSFGIHGSSADNVLRSIERVTERLPIDWVKAHPK